MSAPRVRLQFPGMRKADDCVVHPTTIIGTNEQVITAQGDRLILRLDADGSGMATVNYKGSNPKYFVHLSPLMGAVRIQLTPEQVAMLEGACYRHGEEIGPGVMMA